MAGDRQHLEGRVYPVTCPSGHGDMIRHGYHLDCPDGCGERVEWAFGPMKTEPVTAIVTGPDGCGPALIGYVTVPDLNARRDARQVSR